MYCWWIRRNIPPINKIGDLSRSRRSSIHHFKRLVDKTIHLEQKIYIIISIVAIVLYILVSNKRLLLMVCHLSQLGRGAVPSYPLVDSKECLFETDVLMKVKVIRQIWSSFGQIVHLWTFILDNFVCTTSRFCSHCENLILLQIRRQEGSRPIKTHNTGKKMQDSNMNKIKINLILNEINARKTGRSIGHFKQSCASLNVLKWCTTSFDLE